MKSFANKPFILLAAGSLAAGGCIGPSPTGQVSPNILLIVADDLGWADLGCYGADLHETPHIDKLAAEGILFTNAFAAAPVCSPTRASILTGKYPARLNFTIWSEAASPAERKNQEQYRFLPPETVENLPLSEVTLAELLHEQGYLTAHVGKWHVGNLQHFPETHGFDVSFAASQRGAPPTFFYPYRGPGFGEYRFVLDMGRDAQGNYFTDREGEYLTDRLTDEAMKMMEDAGKRPFFMSLNYYNPHTPIEAKPEKVAYFKAKVKPGMHHQNEIYAAMIQSLDDNVGRLMAKLEELQIASNTLVIFISDNGGYINENRGRVVTSNHPLRSGKGSLYEGGIRIPMIVRLPGNTSYGRKVDTPVSTIDFLPSLMDFLDLPVPDSIDGSSIRPLLSGHTSMELENRPLFWHYPHYYPTTTPVSAVRQGNWKLLHFLGYDTPELYHLESDPGESVNLATERKQIADSLLMLLRNWKAETRARDVLPNPAYSGVDTKNW
jgi:arylsulfatase A